MSESSYDFIIAGGGLAGLSLAWRLKRSTLKDCRLLVIDREKKSSNDHTWCFWDSEPSDFEAAVFHRWKNLEFVCPGGEVIDLPIGESGLEYRMIRAEDLYSLINDDLRRSGSADFLCEEITGIGDGWVETATGRFTAGKYVFDSVSVSDLRDRRYNNLLQHFLGYFVETGKDVFDPDAATLFDFRVPQHGECRFGYVLPLTARRALVEFTVFSKSLLEQDEYRTNLENYIDGILGAGEYEVLEEEFGVIPMSDEPPVTRPFDRTVRIGTAGGYVKPSTGYSFRRTEQRLRSIVSSLENGSGIPDFRTASSRWKLYLDSVFLNVLRAGRHPAADVFERLFRRNPATTVLRFLDEKTGIREDLRIMRTVPFFPFMKAALMTVFWNAANALRRSNQ